MSQAIIIPFSPSTKPEFTSPVAIYYSKLTTTATSDGIHIYIFDHIIHHQELFNFLEDNTLLKISTKGDKHINEYYNLQNIHHMNISVYIRGRGSEHDVGSYKQELMIHKKTFSRLEQHSNIVQLIIKYIKSMGNIKKPVVSTRKLRPYSYYNKKREVLLMYLTIFNEILLINGPMTFITLINMAKKYPNLTSLLVNPAMALEGLITIKALINDPTSTLIYLPEQIST